MNCGFLILGFFFSSFFVKMFWNLKYVDADINLIKGLVQVDNRKCENAVQGMSTNVTIFIINTITFSLAALLTFLILPHFWNK